MKGSYNVILTVTQIFCTVVKKALAAELSLFLLTFLHFQQGLHVLYICIHQAQLHLFVGRMERPSPDP